MLGCTIVTQHSGRRFQSQHLAASHELTIDIRTTPNLSVAKLEKKLNQILKSTKTGATLSMPVAGTAMNTNPDHPLIQQILPATRGLDTAPWFCDAAKLAEIGVPAVALGPGSIAQAHTKDEWIKIKDLTGWS